MIRNLRVAFGKPLFYGVSAKGDSLLGLFGYVDGAVIQNLLLDDVLLAAPSTAGSYRWLWAGAIAAVAANSVLENCGVQQAPSPPPVKPNGTRSFSGGLIGDIYHSSESFTLEKLLC